MSPPFSLCRLAASRLLRAMTLLGWLLMAVSLPVAAGGTHYRPAQAHAASMTGPHAQVAQVAAMQGQHADHCCGTAAHPGCHCEALCGGVLLPAVAALQEPAWPPQRHLPEAAPDAPAPALQPPLRPPAA